MGYIVMVLVDMILCFLTVLYVNKGKKSIFHTVVDANNFFCILYLIFSCLFIWMEKFAVWKPLILIFVGNCLLILWGIYRKWKLKKSNWIEKEELTVAVIVLLMLPLISFKAEDIGTVSDQGAYFFHTAVLMEEKEEDIHTLREFGKISDEVDQGLDELQDNLAIFYHYENENYYYPHALRTWCAFTALSGKVFGLWGCMNICTYLFILIVINMYYISRKIAVCKSAKYLCFGLFAASPLILYIAKAGLSEILVLYLFIATLYYILQNHVIAYILGGVCIGMVGFVHVSMYAYMPIITVMLFLQLGKEKRYIYTQIIQLSLFFISVLYDYKISPIYFEAQYKRLALGGRITYSSLIIFIGAAILIIMLLNIFLVEKHKQLICRIRDFIYNHFKIIAIAIVIIILFRTLYFAYHLCFTDLFSIEEGVDAGTWNLRERYVNTGLGAISYLNLVNIGRATGMVGVGAFFLIAVFKREISDASKTLYFCAFYALIIFTVLQMDTPSNYYSSRYFVPFLIPTIILAVISSVQKKKWIIYLMLFSFLFNFNYWPAFLTGAPRLGQYNILQEVMDKIPEGTLVFCNQEESFVNTRLTTNLRIINDNEVYNLKNIDEVSSFYDGQEQFIISDQELELPDYELLEVLSKIYKSQYSFGNGQNGTYATTSPTYDIPVYVYKIVKE